MPATKTQKAAAEAQRGSIPREYLRQAAQRLGTGPEPVGWLPGTEHPYRLGPNADTVLERIGVSSDVLETASASRRPLLRFCLDWSEQRHHLGGRLGATLLTMLKDPGWITRRAGDRDVTLTDRGRQQLTDTLGRDVTGSASQ